MKLLLCTECGDIFSLRFRLRHCECGTTSGRYLDDLQAEVGETGISLAIDNRTLKMALDNLRNIKPEAWKDASLGERDWPTTAFKAWARPHNGPGNPNTRIAKKDKVNWG